MERIEEAMSTLKSAASNKISEYVRREIGREVDRTRNSSPETTPNSAVLDKTNTTTIGKRDASSGSGLSQEATTRPCGPNAKNSCSTSSSNPLARFQKTMYSLSVNRKVQAGNQGYGSGTHQKPRCLRRRPQT